MSNILNINNKDIDFNKIESEIEENIKKRKEKFENYSKDIEDLQSEYFMHHYNIKMPREISSHRPVVGSLLVKIRRLLDNEIRMSLDPILNEQIDFNKKIIEYLKHNIEKKIEEYQIRIEKLEELMKKKVTRVNSNKKDGN